ncbi:hypothetical protein HAPS_2086 [Glaesserella parasuis SH0165]|uniref:Transposase n=1 Tax=Glaesserella parasuis serovar 5 (strain SH0165) TaxID=557723 RepID=B8F889_GLAP5|nr:hypothetical protein HAPS_2086 [Glaesserella parasuis SH0165]
MRNSFNIVKNLEKKYQRKYSRDIAICQKDNQKLSLKFISIYTRNRYIEQVFSTIKEQL